MSERRRREFSELPITVDRDADASLPDQIAASLREAINREALRPGEPVPATRELASRLKVARGVVVAAYQQLLAEGYLAAGHGRGTQVHPELARRGRSAAITPEHLASGTQGDPRRRVQSDTELGDRDSPAAKPLAPGLPDTSAVDTAAWRSAWRSAAARAHVEAPDLGDPRLRAAISEHLRRMRGTTRPAEDILITAGAREGLGLLLSALTETHGRAVTVGVEDPGYPSLRQVATRHGASTVALTVDTEGLVTANLPENSLDAVLVTPSHQYPLGGSLPLARRRELLDWADRTSTVIIEDDYDSELRHTGSPLPTLAALDDPVAGSVVLLGTFSKTVSQALSAGFLMAPAKLRKVIEPVRCDLGGPVSAVVQHALAEYLESGELRRHTARMRRRYAARRELVVERLFAVPGVRVRPMNGGLHAVIELLHGSPEAEAAVLAHCRDLGVVPLSAYWHGETTERFGLVIGTGGSLDEASFHGALDALRRALLEALGSAA